MEKMAGNRVEMKLMKARRSRRTRLLQRHSAAASDGRNILTASPPGSGQ